jgi:CBS domain-containing membrane protein
VKPSRHWTSLILAGATLRDRALACCGALAGIGLTALVCSLMFRQDSHLPLLVAPMGASAVLLFAVPASPLAQPWSIIGGNTISALIGITVGHLVHEPMIAVGLAVALAIAAMSLTRCLHPPGGAAALTAILGGHSVMMAGFTFAFVPVALNSILLVMCGWLFHKFSRHTYPHRSTPLASPILGTQDIAPQVRSGFRAEDLNAALTDFGEPLDIQKDDLERLLRQVELHALARSTATLTCADIMSRDVISISHTAAPDAAKAFLLHHGIRTLPVVDQSGHVLGTIGWHDLAKGGDCIADLMSPASVSPPQAPAFRLLNRLTSGQTHAVVIVDDDRHIRGIVTQTDLLVAMSGIAGVRSTMVT